MECGVRTRSGAGSPREHLAWGAGCDGINWPMVNHLIRSLPLPVLTFQKVYEDSYC